MLHHSHRWPHIPLSQDSGRDQFQRYTYLFSLSKYWHSHHFLWDSISFCLRRSPYSKNDFPLVDALLQMQLFSWQWPWGLEVSSSHILWKILFVAIPFWIVCEKHETPNSFASAFADFVGFFEIVQRAIGSQKKKGRKFVAKCLCMLRIHFACLELLKADATFSSEGVQN